MGNSIYRWLKKLFQPGGSGASDLTHVSPANARRVFISEDHVVKPGASRQEATMLFCSISNYEEVCAGLDSNVLATLMNQYFEMVISVVMENEGTVIRNFGDAVFAVWNAPLPQLDHVFRACQAGIQIANTADNFPALPGGMRLVNQIGVHTGEVSIGNFGSTKRVDYTAVGENVNVASWLEGRNDVLGTRILISGEVEEAVRYKFIKRRIARFNYPSVSGKVQVFELLGALSEAEETRAWRNAYARALEAFQNREWDSAELALDEVKTLKPDDGPSSFLRKQLNIMRTKELPAEWCGELEVSEKEVSFKFT